MRELPSQGRCHAAFLLAYSARLKPLATPGAWIETALNRTTIMAAATDIPGTAEMLLAAKLARAEDAITLDGRLLRVSKRADHRSLAAIARLLLVSFPPGWVVSAVIDGEFRPEYVPDADLRRLAWLDVYLEPIVLSVYRAITSTADVELRKQIGDAGELAVVSALQRIGVEPNHVALVSDIYGYDIEYGSGAGLHRLEVKACVERTADRVIVTSNEYEKAATLGSSWRLIQVCFDYGIIMRKRATCADVLFIRELAAHSLISLSPPSTEGFRWLESAEFRPPNDSWVESDLQVAADFHMDFSA
ncbi:MAG: DUF3883 domain-containing protein [Gammaproteobacteria bacterium]|nr:DUF3883 domain-containing protein [Gammaproteobacteria bacterium]